MALVSKVMLAGLLLCGASGCVSISLNSNATTATKEAPCRVTVRWLHELQFAPDTTRGGELVPGIVGRIFLFGKDVGCPLESDGSLHVELADVSQGPPKALEEWKLDAPTMKRLLRKDWIGQGYTLFLPWATYRPDIKAIQMKLTFQPVKGSALFATPEVFNIKNEGMSRNMLSQQPPAPRPAPLLIERPELPTLPAPQSMPPR